MSGSQPAGFQELLAIEAVNVAVIVPPVAVVIGAGNMGRASLWVVGGEEVSEVPTYVLSLYHGRERWASL